MKIFLLSLLLSIGHYCYSQEYKDARLDSLVTSGNFLFRAQNALPFRGSQIMLTSNYDVKVKKDSIIAYLPYYGRAFTAPIDPLDGGIQFTSTKFKAQEKKKKSRWEITWTIDDARDVRKLYLSIAANGFARLQVVSQNRDPISFSGYIDGIK